MKTSVKDIIFVFGNPIRQVQELGKKYDIEVIGTSVPDNLISELSTANDVSQFFFIVTDEEELGAVNKMFRRLVKRDNTEPNMFVIIDKRYIQKLKVGNSKVYVKDFIDLTESVLTDLVFSTVIHNQTQYFLEVEREVPTTMPKEKMERVARILNNVDSQNTLEGIRTQFKIIKQNQDSLMVTKLVLNSESEGKAENDIKMETQEFLREKIDELKAKLSVATTKTDLEDLMTILLELLNMRSDDLKESSVDFIQKIIDEEIEKGKALSEESRNALEEIESTLIDGDKKEIEFLVQQRTEYINKLNTVVREVNARVEMIKSVSVKYLGEIKETSMELLSGEYRSLLPVESRIAFKESYKNNGLAIQESTILLVEKSNEVIQDLQTVVSKYNNLVNLDTSIIESQQRLVETLTTQKVVERVQYTDPLSVKLNVLVSPTPNLGVSTILKVFKNKWKSMLVLDFREIISDPKGFTQLEFDDLMNGNIDLFKSGYVKVNVPMANDVDEAHLEERLNLIESEFEYILVVVDKYITTGISFDRIQKIMYLTDSAEKNLLEINKIIQLYEPLMDKLKKRMLILNKMTKLQKQEVKTLTTIAGVDPTRVKINIIDISVELIDGDEVEYKNINNKFNYF